MHTDKEEWVAWIRLKQTVGVGPETARKLLSVFGLPQNIFSASFSQLQGVVSEKIAQAIASPLTDYARSLIDATNDWLAQSGNRLMTLADADYPKMLLEIPDPPILLYVKGRAELLSAPSMAVVGSRNATAQGCIDAERFSEALSEIGITIVSGLALGIDSAAHQGGLRAQGSTVAVIGTGADIVYPARNHGLAHKIAEEGCIVSEYPLGTAALAANFPRRNRIISGLSRGVLVVEAAAKSGSLITARTALEQGREVFAIPGSIHSPLSRGCHQLIRQGAKLVESSQDILEDLKHFGSVTKDVSDTAPTLDAGSPEEDILLAMGFDPVDMDALIQRCQLDAASLHVKLLHLELDGKVEILPGGLYRRLIG